MSTIEELAQEIEVCQRCQLGSVRGRAVPGEGPIDAEVLFIGEAPGWHEDQQGRPFVGPAGQLLDQLLGQAGLRRTDVFVTNIIKCRPPNNRDPLPAEVEACHPWLDAQILGLSPRLVVTLGRYSAARYFPREPMSRIHGQVFQRDGVVVVPMYHPAAALHQGSLRATIETDFKKLPAAIAQARSMRRSIEKPEERPQQLNLFD
jgi:uracil-DNA glycosylase family 4